MKAVNRANLDDLEPVEPAELERLLASRQEIEQAKTDLVEGELLKGIASMQFEISAAALDADTALQRIAEGTMELMQASGVAIALLSGQDVVCRARVGAAPEVGTLLERDQGLSGECLRSGQTIRCGDTTEDPRVDAEACRQLNVRSAAVLPICSGERVVGVLDIFSSEPHAFDDPAILALSKVAQTVAGIAARSSDENAPARDESGVPAVPPVGVTDAIAIRARKAHQYFLIAVAGLVVMAYMAMSFRPRESAPQPVQRETVPAPTSVPAEPAPQIVSPTVDAVAPAPSAEAEQQTDEQAEPATPPATGKQKTSKPKPVPGARHVSVTTLEPRKLRAPDSPPQAPPMAVVPPRSSQDALGNVVRVPAGDPKLAPGPAPDVTATKSDAPARQPKAKSNRLSRILKKPVKALRKKDKKTEAGASQESATPPAPPPPTPQ